jgi:hypothetical protein
MQESSELYFEVRHLVFFIMVIVLDFSFLNMGASCLKTHNLKEFSIDGMSKFAVCLLLGCFGKL